MSLHLWEHYAFGGDKEFLRQRAYPRLKEIAEFLLDYLVEAADGTLLSGPSQSPENKYRLPDGTTASLCMSPAMDTEIILAVFDRVARGSELLGIDQDLRKQVQSAAKRLPPLKIAKTGALQEWNEDHEETELGHRHISHLFALFPDSQITPSETPELAHAARKVLERRLLNGGGSTGWSRAWLINCWARLEDGEEFGSLVLRRGPSLIDQPMPAGLGRREIRPALQHADILVFGLIAASAAVPWLAPQEHSQTR